MEEPVHTEKLGATLLVQLNRPGQRNAMDIPMREALARAVVQARDDDTVKSVILTGSGGSFCAGGDLKSLSAPRPGVFKDRDRVRKVHLWFRELVNLEKPVIAAVDGPAFGAGFNIALACDFILVTPQTRFCSVFGRVGLAPDLGGLFLLPRIVGLQRAKEIIFSTREIGADEALALGIAFAVVPREQLMERATELAARFHGASTEVLGITKNILNRSFNLDQDALVELEANAQALALNTQYHQDAVGRFLNKQQPAFKWPD